MVNSIMDKHAAPLFHQDSNTEHHEKEDSNNSVVQEADLSDPATHKIMWEVMMRQRAEIDAIQKVVEVLVGQNHCTERRCEDLKIQLLASEEAREALSQHDWINANSWFGGDTYLLTPDVRNIQINGMKKVREVLDPCVEECDRAFPVLFRHNLSLVKKTENNKTVVQEVRAIAEEARTTGKAALSGAASLALVVEDGDMEGTMHRMSTQLDAVWEKAEQLTSEACNISERQENFNRKFEAANKTVQNDIALSQADIALCKADVAGCKDDIVLCNDDITLWKTEVTKDLQDVEEKVERVDTKVGELDRQVKTMIIPSIACLAHHLPTGEYEDFDYDEEWGSEVPVDESWGEGEQEEKEECGDVVGGADEELEEELAEGAEGASEATGDLFKEDEVGEGVVREAEGMEERVFWEVAGEAREGVAEAVRTAEAAELDGVLDGVKCDPSGEERDRKHAFSGLDFDADEKRFREDRDYAAAEAAAAFATASCASAAPQVPCGVYPYQYETYPGHVSINDFHHHAPDPAVAMSSSTASYEPNPTPSATVSPTATANYADHYAFNNGSVFIPDDPARISTSTSVPQVDFDPIAWLFSPGNIAPPSPLPARLDATAASGPSAYDARPLPPEYGTQFDTVAQSPKCEVGIGQPPVFGGIAGVEGWSWGVEASTPGGSGLGPSSLCTPADYRYPDAQFQDMGSWCGRGCDYGNVGVTGGFCWGSDMA